MSVVVIYHLLSGHRGAKRGATPLTPSPSLIGIQCEWVRLQRESKLKRLNFCFYLRLPSIPVCSQRWIASNILELTCSSQTDPTSDSLTLFRSIAFMCLRQSWMNPLIGKRFFMYLLHHLFPKKIYCFIFSLRDRHISHFTTAAWTIQWWSCVLMVC